MFSIVDVPSLSGCFQDFFFVFALFQKFNYNVFGIEVFRFILFELSQFLISVVLFCQTLRFCPIAPVFSG